ncbi:MAG: FecCD family ABC transporter permease [Actinomycetota bacterium]
MTAAPVVAHLGRSRARPWVVIAGLGGLLLAALAGISFGPAGLEPVEVLKAVLDRLPLIEVPSSLSDRHLTILWELRLPRVALGGLVGAMLALAGAAYQGVFRNPLADPYLLGVAAGAGLGATLAIAVGSDGGRLGANLQVVPLAAFVGAVAGVVATYLIGRRFGDRTATTLVLAGVAVASFLTAAQTYVQQRSAGTLREVYAWILGRLSTTGWNEVSLILPYVAVSALGVLVHRRLLDVMALGDGEAAGLGVPVGRVRLLVVGAATLGTAAAVAVSGLIGFVGIIVPHTVRLLTGISFRFVLPLSMVFGAAFMMATDLAARTIVAPAELPIGVVTAFVGAPFFILVLHRSRRGG